MQALSHEGGISYQQMRKLAMNWVVANTTVTGNTFLSQYVGNNPMDVDDFGNRGQEEGR